MKRSLRLPLVLVSLMLFSLGGCCAYVDDPGYCVDTLGDCDPGLSIAIFERRGRSHRRHHRGHHRRPHRETRPHRAPQHHDQHHQYRR